MEEKLFTFDQVADLYRLPAEMKKRYIKYMRTRWANEEATQCDTGYASEWAMRFLAGHEYGASDSEGQAILRNIDG